MNQKTIELYLAHLTDSQQRTLTILDSLLAGDSVSTIAKQHAVTRDYVYQIKRRYDIK
ncbi:helix-turn-helix domain-containing protein [Vibrio sp. FNV 38]|nr:helix-turn-helix domain-containing protein [Vibrio sp. FNV 38]